MHQYMKRALQLAKKGMTSVSPNPMVGAVLIKNNKVIGEGFHEKKGGPHAEVMAIRNASEPVEGSTLICTLEPCCHRNKLTPPCTDLILEKKIKKVIVASLDPNPEVSGKGLRILEENGVEIEHGILKEEANHLNKVFLKNMNASLPYVHLKSAITLDGRVATNTGDSKWISSEEARYEVHRIREAYDSIMIGAGTLRIDNPKLTARLGVRITKKPRVIILGDLSQDDLKLDIFKSPERILNIYKASTAFEGNSIKSKENWREDLKALYLQGICSILVEGGSIILSSLIESNLFDEATFYVCPKAAGNGKSFFQSNNIKNMDDAIRFDGKWRINTSGEAILEVRK